MENFTEEYLKARERFRRFIAVILGIVVAVGGFILLSGVFGSDEIAAVSYWPLVIGALTVLGWWSAQSDNRDAEATGDKTLIVSSWSRDLTVVGLSLLAASVLSDFIGFLPWAIVLGSGLSSLAGWLVGRHLWKRAPNI